MTRIFLADAQFEERAALRLVILDLGMEFAGEAADWTTTLAQAPATAWICCWWIGPCFPPAWGRNP